MTHELPSHNYVQELLALDLPDTTPSKPINRPRARRTKHLRALHEALSPYIDIKELRRLAVTSPQELYQALRHDEPPQELRDLLQAMRAILSPPERTQIKSPTDLAALLMIEMAHLDQEQLRTVLLDTKHRVQDVVTVYVGSVNTAMIRIGEIYKAAVRANSTSIVVAHNHPSSDPTPSPEDILVTRQIVEAGKLLDIDCIDHIIIGQGRFVSMRERGLGF